jgi:hypothetical protein
VPRLVVLPGIKEVSQRELGWRPTVQTTACVDIPGCTGTIHTLVPVLQVLAEAAQVATHAATPKAAKTAWNNMSLTFSMCTVEEGTHTV